jgi:hypothetical protein
MPRRKALTKKSPTKLKPNITKVAIPVDTHSEKQHLSPKDVFLHLLTMLALYFTAGSIITLLFQYVNVLIPDPLFSESYDGQRAYLGPLRFALSSLVITFPSFIGLSWLLHKGYKADSSRRATRLRKWLIYFTVFVTAIIIAADLIGVVYNYLEGELTSRFALKAVSVLVVAGIIFAYYLWDVRQEQVSEKVRYFAWPVIIVITAGIIGGFVLAGSPQQERLYRIDEQRLNDLYSLNSQVYSYYSSHNQLPQLQHVTVPTDPVTEEPYEYRVLNDTTFELCTTFNFSDHSNTSKTYPASEYGMMEVSWYHGAGYTCFTRSIEPALKASLPAQ